jgi:hypothetical protein
MVPRPLQARLLPRSDSGRYNPPPAYSLPYRQHSMLISRIPDPDLEPMIKVNDSDNVAGAPVHGRVLPPWVAAHWSCCPASCKRQPENTLEITLWLVLALGDVHVSQRVSFPLVIRQWVFDGLPDQVGDAELAVLGGAELASFGLEVGLGHEVGLWIAEQQADEDFGDDPAAHWDEHLAFLDEFGFFEDVIPQRGVISEGSSQSCFDVFGDVGDIFIVGVTSADGKGELLVVAADDFVLWECPWRALPLGR